MPSALSTPVLLLTLLLALVPAAVPAADGAGRSAVATAHPLATAAGLEVLAAGGNAFDAAVTVTAVLAVVEPYSSGIGGGGFYLLHLAAEGRDVMVDARERAPAAASPDMYLDEQGEPIPGASVNGPLAAGIPGIPAALEHLANKYGRRALRELLQPAVRAADQGFEVDAQYRRLATFRRDALTSSPQAAATFLIDGEVPAEGSLIRQRDLATTLQRIAAYGARGFYEGQIGFRLAEGVRKAGGIWTAEDLKQYRVVEREPVRFDFRGMRVTAAAPPSSGGVALATMLNVLDGYDWDALGEADRAHLLVEAMRRAYRDRAEHLGDPDYVDVPVARLIDPDYAAGLRASIRADVATASAALPGVTEPAPGTHTTHFSIVDREGNRVAATLSINYPFGSGFMVPGTGVLLNDEMDDFAAKPGAPNVYGLVGAAANAVEPGKRMLSSMTPSFLETAERVAVIGTPGGSRIITMVLLGALAFADGASAEAIVAWPRLHHQYLPDKVFLEPDALTAATRAELERRGHRLEEADRRWGNMQVVILDKQSGEVSAASDPRGVGRAGVR